MIDVFGVWRGLSEKNILTATALNSLIANAPAKQISIPTVFLSSLDDVCQKLATLIIPIARRAFQDGFAIFNLLDFNVFVGPMNHFLLAESDCLNAITLGGEKAIITLG